MKFNAALFALCNFLLLIIFSSSCSQEEEETYPIVYEYHELAFSPTLWYVLTSSSQNQINQPLTAVGYDDEVRSILEDNVSDIPFKRMEFLTDSTVKLTFTDGINSLDTVLTYTVVQGKTKIHIGLTPAEDIIFYEGTEPHTLNLGIISTLYSFKLPNGTVDYSPIVFEYSSELDPLKILNGIRVSENLESNDTVAVNIAKYVFK
ncbi:MAG: hypothetical protein Q8K92_06965 [Leadbetterella sp.]|nr:hypothetical protein [Leadbetterella sp.]